MTTTLKARQKILAHHHFVFNKKDNGGESVGLSTHIVELSPGVIEIQQEFFLNSYCNGASINLNNNHLSADKCREAANELDRKWIQVSAMEPQPSDTQLDRHDLVLIPSPESLSGNTLSLVTFYFDNGDKQHGIPDDNVFTNQRLVMARYNDSASINLSGASITSEGLRQLANELDQFMVKNLPTSI